jgi:ABC-type transporter Mla subunit MlaD
LDTLVGEIATASREQTQGLSQVTTAVSQMDQITQGNAATAEETAAASQELNTQATALSEAVASLRSVIGESSPNFVAAQRNEGENSIASGNDRSRAELATITRTQTDMMLEKPWLVNSESR